MIKMSTRFDAKITLTSWFFFVHLLVLASLVSFPVRADLLNRLIPLVTKGNSRIAFPFAMDNTVLVSDCINLFHMWYETLLYNYAGFKTRCFKT